MALAAAKLAGATAWPHVQDFEADAAYGVGLLMGELTASCGWSVGVFAQFDIVSGISKRMLNLVPEKRVAPLANHLLYQLGV